MALFDIIVQKNENFKGYTGNPPTSESEYNAMKDGISPDRLRVVRQEWGT